MKTYLNLLLLAAVVLASCSKKEASPEALARYDQIVPKPVTIEVQRGAFVLTSDASIGLVAPSDESRQVAGYLSALLKPATGFNLATAEGEEKAAIVLEVADVSLGSEGYVLRVTSDQVRITAPSGAGLFYGVQTLRQLLPPSIESSKTEQTVWEIAAGTITDKPALGWRGSMLDVARHFFGMDDVKRYIDYLAMYKFNVVHLHLKIGRAHV